MYYVVLALQPGFAWEIKTISFASLTQTFPIAVEFGAWKLSSSFFRVEFSFLSFCGQPWLYEECA